MRKRVISALLAITMCFLPAAQAASAYVYAAGRMEGPVHTLSGNGYVPEGSGDAAGKTGQESSPANGGEAVEEDGVKNGGMENGGVEESGAGNGSAEENGAEGTPAAVDGEKIHTLSGADLEGAATLSGNRAGEGEVTLTTDYKGIRVTVAGPAEVFPEGSSLRVAELESEDLMLYATSIYDAELPDPR